eukprot:8407465-Pyramimonas_sp.AAC.1
MCRRRLRRRRARWSRCWSRFRRLSRVRLRRRFVIRCRCRCAGAGDALPLLPSVAYVVEFSVSGFPKLSLASELHTHTVLLVSHILEIVATCRSASNPPPTLRVLAQRVPS